MANHNQEDAAGENRNSTSNERLSKEPDGMERRTVLKGAASAATALPFIAGSAQGASETRRLEIISTREPAERNSLDVNYEFTATGEISTVTGLRTNSAEGNDSITQNDDGTWTATGTTGNGFGDAYDFVGEIHDFSGEGAFKLRLEGTTVTQDELVSNDDHAIEILSTDGSSGVEYTFRTTGEIEKVYDSRGNSAELFGDSVRENDDGTWSAEGYTGHGYGDTYTFAGTLEDFSPVEDIVEVRVDGSPIDLSQFESGSSDGSDDGQTVLSASGASRTNASIQTEHSGYAGDGYINFAASGGSATWTVETDSAGTHGLNIDYALGDSASRTANLVIDGETFEITAEPTGGWATWATLPLAVDLPAGSFDISIETTGADWGNIDRAVLRDEPVSDAVEPTKPAEPVEGGGTGFTWDQTHVDTSWVQNAGDDITVETVTTTEPYGNGSLGEALSNAESNNATLIVFEVGGVIDHGGEVWMRSQADNVWIAGQTAPAPGITMIRGGLRVHGDNTIVEHMTILPGDDTNEPVNADAANAEDDTTNILFNHCTFGWGTDVTFVVHPGASNIGVINCINAEALNDSSHPEAPHGYGFNIRGDAGPITYMGNLHNHNWGRNPRPNDGHVVMANNYMYNWGKGIVHGGDMQSAEMDWINNVIEAGPDTETDAGIFDGWNPTVYWESNDVYPTDQPLGDSNVNYVNNPMNLPSGVSLDSFVNPSELDTWLAARVGPRPADRAPHEQRVVGNFTSRSGRIIDNESDVGGYPSYSTTQRSLSPPSSGISDWIQGYTNEVETGE